MAPREYSSSDMVAMETRFKFLLLLLVVQIIIFLITFALLPLTNFVTALLFLIIWAHVFTPVIVLLETYHARMTRYQIKHGRDVLITMVDESPGADDAHEVKANLAEKFHRTRIYRVQYQNDAIINHCTVCNLPIYAKEEVIECPICHDLIHKSHFLEWLKIKGSCPSCKSHLRDSQIPSKS
jgi:ABC-type multidrug transport system fused ATPase/permease subunit